MRRFRQLRLVSRRLFAENQALEQPKQTTSDSNDRYNPKNYDFFDYDGTKYSYEINKNYGSYASEELFGITRSDLVSATQRKHKTNDNIIFIFATVMVALTIYTYSSESTKMLNAFQNRVERESRDVHLERPLSHR